MITLVYAIIYVNESTYNIAFIIIISFMLSVALFLFNRKVLNKKLNFLNQLVLMMQFLLKMAMSLGESRSDLVGSIMMSYTDLRPAGVAVLNEEKFDVVTDGDFIEKR